jgi:hypothetical protein
VEIFGLSRSRTVVDELGGSNLAISNIQWVYLEVKIWTGLERWPWQAANWCPGKKAAVLM